MNKTLGKVLAVIAGLLPIVYIGWLVRHFVGVGGGSVKGIVDIGLGPTVIGLSLVGVIIALPLIIKLLRVTTGVSRVPGKSSDAAIKPGEIADELAFDADAAFANYMRKRDQPVAVPPGEPGPSGAADESGPPPVRAARFGRKGLG